MKKLDLRLFAFKDYRFDAEKLELRKNGEIVPVQRKPLQCLSMLLRNAGKLVEKNEFLETVWKDTFTSDESLHVAVRQLRKIFGDNPRNPEFIENMCKYGYRFIADVEVISPDENGRKPFLFNLKQITLSLEQINLLGLDVNKENVVFLVAG
jgi:DNA-binding winged helix-turn-helix (wHTH) protein